MLFLYTHKPACFLNLKIDFTIPVVCNPSCVTATVTEAFFPPKNTFRFISSFVFILHSHARYQNIQLDLAVLFLKSLLRYDVTEKRYWPIIGEQATRGSWREDANAVMSSLCEIIVACFVMTSLMFEVLTEESLLI